MLVQGGAEAFTADIPVEYIGRKAPGATPGGRGDNQQPRQQPGIVDGRRIWRQREVLHHDGFKDQEVSQTA